jgi:hypothetical protein
MFYLFLIGFLLVVIARLGMLGYGTLGKSPRDFEVIEYIFESFAMALGWPFLVPIAAGKLVRLVVIKIQNRRAQDK